MTDTSTEGIKTVLHPVSDVAKAKAVYTALLGVEPMADESYYVGYEVAGQHIGLVPGGGPQGMTHPVAYWHVEDIKFEQGLLDRMMNVGSITVMSNDRTNPKLELHGIPDPRKIFDALKERVIAVKRQRGVIKMDMGT